MNSRKSVWLPLLFAFIACDSEGITDSNDAPEAVISAEATGERGQPIALDASSSVDPDGDALTYAWTFSSRPAGSTATIAGAAQAAASFVPDAVGSYVVQLTVSDGEDQDVATRTITVDIATLGGPIDSDSIIRNTNSPPGEADYRMSAFTLLTANANVTIEPGVTIRMGEGSGIYVPAGGSLRAVGTAAAPIRLIGEQSVPGYWNNVEFDSNDALNELAFVEIAHAGGNSFAAVLVDGRLTLTHSTVRDSDDLGLWASSSSTLPDFASNVFQNNALGSLEIPAQLIGSLDAATDYLGSGSGVVHVYGSGGFVTGTQTWRAIDAPIRVDEFELITVTGAVTVQPGALFVMAEGSGLYVAAGGSFSAVGTAADTIRFVGEIDEPGHWNNLEFDSDTTANRLSYVEVANAGGNSYGAVMVEGTLRMDHTLIRHSGDMGLEVAPNAELPGFSSNHFAANAGVPMRIPARLMGSIDRESTYVDNSLDRLHVYGDPTDTGQTWPKTSAPFFLEAFGMITINSPIVVEPGFRLVMGQGSSVHLPLGAGGSIDATGTATDSIYFVGEQQVAGFWNNLEIDSDGANTMSFVEIGYGGGNSYGMLLIEGTLTIADSHVHHSGDWGVELAPSATYNASNVTYSENTLGDVK